MSLPLVAVVTPTYNGGRFLAETMESVQQQDWPNLVHIVLDNNSSDNTEEIVSAYLNKRIPVLCFRNDKTLDQRENWTKAYRLVPRDAVYVRYLCDDDTISPTSISKMAALGETFPNVGVIGSLHECAGAVQDFFWPPGKPVFPGKDAMRMALLRQGILMPVQMMWRRRVTDALEPLFASAMDGSWDLDTVFRMLAISDFGFVHEALGFTRVHENTVTALHYAGKTRAWTRDGLDLIMRHGPIAFGTDYRRQLLAFRRYYVRRILTWWREDRGRDHLQPHFDALARAGFGVNGMLVVDAVLDWIYVKLGMRRAWSGYPGWQ
ncbi:glycosyltransferase family A protein [Rhizobium sullae]|uniref:glycosyltransferase family A protein n=1 Tax=Rhizobium sullae TaxID=50338 RepID=UPI000B35FA16|nr:glycosyltransferase family 2 protein [Rhizobium sullae]